MIIAKTIVALPGLPAVHVILSTIKLGGEPLYFVQTMHPRTSQTPTKHYSGPSHADALRAYRTAVDNILSPEI